ncbi:carboxylic ester hydrolase [Cavenderia fasciculata]|uniref:Lipase n=1 Tax=Cavenderia fasciculata TaxID=261658 RepID=F4PHR8_CACFS|nr:carboxylic ester hydrolase [Cavenderia fasciculata]EGG25252.1 carboxylic ester hydrolase [Cavenderia fasciculata]|eukprot:XP_004363103.1 carboxylic ester hydrolase [Cavenderia fasciculata]
MKSLINLLLLILYITTTTTTIVASSKPFVEKTNGDDLKTFEQIVMGYGYPCESHYVTTQDGYILQLFRIPYGQSGDTHTTRQPVLLQHGLLDSSFTWIVNLPGQSLAYILADQGYDVWMGNNRGNTYSTNHTTLSPESAQFWDFSFDEMGRYDLPATMEYVVQSTGYKTLPYIGHSEGTIQAWISYLSNSSVVDWAPLFIGLGPVGNVSNIQNNGLKYMAIHNIDTDLAKMGMLRFLPSPTLLRSLFVDFCLGCDECCAGVIEALCGPHRGAFNDSRMSVVAGHEPGGTSLKNMQHWAQGVREKQFQAFDYGSSSANILHYNDPAPPVYDVRNFPSSVKVALFSGGMDELADPIDVSDLVKQLPSSSLLVWKIIPNYAHLDYVWAIDANTVIYQDVVQLIQKYF